MSPEINKSNLQFNLFSSYTDWQHNVVSQYINNQQVYNKNRNEFLIKKTLYKYLKVKKKIERDEKITKSNRNLIFLLLTILLLLLFQLMKQRLVI